jgi:uncharacterized integral membrane protein
VLQAVVRELTASREHPFAAAVTRRQRAIGFVAYWGLLVALVFSVVTAFGLNFNSVSHAGWASWARLGVGCLLIAVGLLLVSNWQGSRQLALRRLYDRVHGRDDRPPPRLRLWFWRLVPNLLVLVAAVWVAVGAFELTQALSSIL